MGKLTEAEAEMMEGYRDGREDTRDEPPSMSNRSPAYIHGWLNGRDDRTKKPRATAEELRRRASVALRETMG